MTHDAGLAGVEAAERFDAWHPGLRSQIPGELQHLATIFRPEHTLTSLDEVSEFRDLTGLPPAELVAFRPRRLALHEVLIRVTANLSVPDGSRIEDLGINFRRMTQTLLDTCIEPRMAEIDALHETLRRQLSQRIAERLPAAIDKVDAQATSETPVPSPEGEGPVAKRGFLAWLLGRRARSDDVTANHGDVSGSTTANTDAHSELIDRVIARVLSALVVRHGRVWGSRDIVLAVATNLAANEVASEAIGSLIEPWMNEAATRAGYRLLSRQDAPVVMNTKGPSASGKSTLRPLQRRLAGDIGVDWREFALISPDIWRKQLIEYEALGACYKYGAMFTGDELHIIDLKLDRYMARKAARDDMPHLLIDRFRFDSFAPDSNEAGSNLLTRFGHIVYMFFMITPPASLVERAWKRGLDVGRYKAVDDTLAHSVEAYAGMPQLFFTWTGRKDKRVHFEFLDNTVVLGARPRTVAFGWNDTLNVLDVSCMLAIERYRQVNVDATSPSELYPHPECLDAARNTRFLVQCVAQFAVVNFADRDSGRVYLQLRNGATTAADADLLRHALLDADTGAGIRAIAPDIERRALPPISPTESLLDANGAERAHTLGQWGSPRS
jgi:hypothetical protein